MINHNPLLHKSRVAGDYLFEGTMTRLQEGKEGIKGYDCIYQRLVTSFDLKTVTGFFSMQAIIDNRPADLSRMK